MLVWFAILARARRRSRSSHNPAVLAGAQPALRHRLLRRPTGWLAFLALGSVVLAVTGGEALYADMGHFGRLPIRLAWFALRPAGAAAQLLRPGRPAARRTPPPSKTRSSTWRPDWALLPLVVLATLATVIASQAVISGAFSLTRQAVQLGFLPRMQIVHTSGHEEGQIYMPVHQLDAAISPSSSWSSASRLLDQPGRRLRHRGDRHHDDRHDPRSLRHDPDSGAGTTWIAFPAADPPALGRHRFLRRQHLSRS